jgi:PAS domain S-box-containing protein
MAIQGKRERVDSTAAVHSRQDIHQCRKAIAHQWYLAFASPGSLQVDRTEALQKFSDLTDQVIAFLLAENPQVAAAREIGTDLASLPCLDPLAMEISGQLWASQLDECVFPAEPAAVYPRLVILLNGMAAGFNKRSREIVLHQQEGIRSAMAADLLRTAAELRKYQSQLEAMLADRTRELQESEEQFRTIADTSMEGIYQSTEDPDAGTLIYVNNAFAKMLGYTKEELIGRSTLSLIAKVELPKIPALAVDMQGNRPVEGEFRLRHKDGHLVDVHFSVVPTTLKGRTVRSGFLQDITERKRIQAELFQSEERYRTLTEASPDMIFIIGQDDRIQYVNSFAAAFFKLPAEEIIGQPRERFFPTRADDHQKKNIMKALKEGKASYAESDMRMNGKSIWLGTWLVPLRDVAENISGVMGVARNITRQKRAELEIRRSRDQLEKRVGERTAELTTSQNQLRLLTNQLVTAQEEERRRISRELHDEAGQALISMKYGLASIESDIPRNHRLARERLADSMNNIDRVMDQIRSLTHSLRPPVLEILGINLSLKDYCEEFSKRTGLSIHYQGEEVPGLPDEIGISFYRFAQEAFTNILKHAHATKAKVRLQYRKNQITLTISDDGCGMEDTPPSDGIGLIGIKERFNLLGGYLQIHTRKGGGVRKTACVPWSSPAENI